MNCSACRVVTLQPALVGPGSITNAALLDSSGHCRIALSRATHGPFAAMTERGHVVAGPASVDANQENQRPPM